MPNLRFPIMTWREPEKTLTGGAVTAVVLDYHDGDGDPISAMGESAREARDQLVDYLQWLGKKFPWMEGPDFDEPQLLTIRVNVRPEYEADGRTFPCPESFPLQVPTVIGKRSGRVLGCVAPTIGMNFNFTERDEHKSLVTQYVQQELKGLTPQQLARFAPPRDIEIDTITVRTPGYRESRGKEKVNLPELEAVAVRIGSRAMRQSMSRAWERDDAARSLVRMLENDRASVIIVGEPGSGKTTVLHEAVQQIRRAEKDDDSLVNQLLNEFSDEDSNGRGDVAYRYWLTSAARIIAGMRYLGEWQERCETLIGELSIVDGVLCIENLLDLMRVAGAEEGIAGFLLPYIQRGELRLVGEATPAELDACRRLMPGFADAFQVLTLEPFTRPQAITVLDRVASIFKQNRNVEARPRATETVYRLFHRFMPYQVFPGRAVAFLRDILDQAARDNQTAIDIDDVIFHFAMLTGLPELFLRDELPLVRDAVLGHFHGRIKGQDPACAVMVDVVLSFKAAVNDPARPLGVMLFTGPTGVGKTELVKVIAGYLFPERDEKDRMIRLDMSEYSGPGSARRLLGDPYGEPSDIIRRVRQQPFVVLLLDEIEKADSEVFDVLLNVLDEGRLVDHFGRLTTFRSALIIMTSNLGAQVGDGFGFNTDDGEQQSTADVEKFFRPEFFNRIDAVVNFAPLSEPVVRKIATHHLKQIASREGLAAGNFNLTWTDQVLDHIIKHGFDARYGARPLQRAIETLVVAPLARWLVDHTAIVAGDNPSLQLQVDGEQIVIYDRSMNG